MKRQWYYRGSLKSCNYKCSYCPFSKKKGSEDKLEEDKEALFHFIEEFNCLEAAEGAVQIIPYGEAMIHPYYWEGLARLSRNPRLDAVGAQSNFSFPVKQMLSLYCGHGGELDKLRLWGTFHPEMTSVERFVKQCEDLSAHGVSYCAGAVGVPGQIEMIRRLRRELPSSVYLWINKMDGLGRSYTAAEIEAFLEIDAYFDMELAHYKADASLCADNRFVEADGTMHRCNLCRQSLGNFYDDLHHKQEYVPACTRKECSCYLSYCNRREEQLIFFQPYPAFRIPTYPKAFFIDVDGTLIPEGESKIPEKYQKWLTQLAGRCDIYLATSLPYEIARKKAEPIWHVLHGGVFANGGRWMIWDNNGQNEILADEIEALDIGWLAQAEKKKPEYGFKMHLYKKKNGIYKVTLSFRKGQQPVISTQGYLDKIKTELNIPDSCQLLQEENCIQVTKKGTGKLKGILNICRKMGYMRKEAAVIGNSENDIPMLEYFPFSMAAKGSSERVKESANLNMPFLP